MKVDDPGVEGGLEGRNLYCEKITYTGHGSSEGRYSVVFNRDRELGEDRRVDVQISGRLAFKRVTADLLREIEVQLDDVNIRSYELHYKEGEFYKTLLDSITEYDAADAPFVGHKFEYYDEVINEEIENNGLRYTALGDSDEWTPQSDGIQGDFINPFNGFDDKSSALNGTKSTSFGAGAAITIGPDDGNAAGKSLTIGGDFNFSLSNSKGMLSLVDINGDGLADKVFKKGDKLLFRPNLGEGDNSFGDTLEIHGVSRFYKEKSRTFGGGFQQNGAVAPASFFAGLNLSKTTSVTKVYFTDVNGDQLTDIIVNGQVWYNHLNGNGNPTFTQSSLDTPSPIDETGSIDASVVMTDPDEETELLAQHPLHDVVRVWIAPYTGMVNIDAPVQLIRDTTERRAEYKLDDGIRAIIEKADCDGNNALLSTGPIDSTSNYIQQPMSLSSIMVEEGEKIFFRLQSIHDGDFDKVRWNPVITYVGESESELDVNGKSKYQFNAEDDFKLSGVQTVTMPFDGKVTIAGIFNKSVTTDSVRLEIHKGVYDENTNTTIETLYDSLTYNWDATAEDIEIEYENIDVQRGETYRFRVASNTNVNWPEITWSPHIYYTDSDDENYPDSILVDTAGMPIVDFYSVVEYTMYTDEISMPASWIAPTDNTVSVVANLPGSFPTDATGTITFSVKSPDKLLASQVIEVNNGNVAASPPITAMVTANEEVYLEYHTDNRKLAEAFGASPAAGIDGTVVNAGLHTVPEEFKFGPLYRNWGQFAYNSNDGRDTICIIEEELEMDTDLMALGGDDAPDLQNAQTSDELQAGYGEDGFDPSNSIFIMLLPSAQEQAWMGYDNLTFIKADTMSSSRMGLDDVSPVIPLAEGVNVRAIDRVTKSTNTSFSLGGGLLIYSVSYNESDGTSVTITDFADMNGDRRPDIVGLEKIHYTTARGGLEEEARSHMLEGNTLNTSHSGGFNLGGSYSRSSTTTQTFAQVGSFKGGSSSSTGVAQQNLVVQTSTTQSETTSSLGVSGNVSVSDGDDYTNFTWMDINGDGLADRVYNDSSTVALNLGYSFTPPEPWGYVAVNEGASSTESAGLGVSFGNMSVSLGVGLTRSNNLVKKSLRDVNGDGLIDEVIQEGDPLLDNLKVKVRLNLGNGFSDETIEWAGLETISSGASTGESANVGFTIVIPIKVAGIKICINPNGNAGQGATKQLTNMADINGDGYPDYLSSDEDDNLSVQISFVLSPAPSVQILQWIILA